MTPREFVKSKGYGYNRMYAKKIGYTENHFCSVLANKIRPSHHMLRCLSQIFPEMVDLSTLLQPQRKPRDVSK